ncbi:hypothetical protein PNOK_0174100 [Pyrrhoderma noxium]|uniref:Uncharacterized protein n=1 Tax=Pyrrhoderma noxium TaxID=2282107 RepID=A0A286UQI8_9AGAM|nr:hypothetical protein PNOK_0174100 [Pyrrhoderma noxium]
MCRKSRDFIGDYGWIFPVNKSFGCSGSRPAGLRQILSRPFYSVAIKRCKTAAEFLSQKHGKAVYPSLTLVMYRFILKHIFVCRQSLARAAYDIRGKYLKEEKEHWEEDYFDWTIVSYSEKATDFRDEDDEPHPLTPLIRPYNTVRTDLYALDQSSAPPLRFSLASPEVTIDFDSAISTLDLDAPAQSESISTPTDILEAQAENATKKGMIKGRRMFYACAKFLNSRINPAKRGKNLSK